MVKAFDARLDRSFDMEMILAVERAKAKTKFDFAKSPQQGENLRKDVFQKIINDRLKSGTFERPIPNEVTSKSLLDIQNELEETGKKFYSLYPAFNDADLHNTKFEVKKFEIGTTEHVYPLRTGVLAFKVGMMSTFDIWGTHIPLTVLQIDRCQITQIKETTNPEFVKVQVGAGLKSMRFMRKSQAGHFLRANLIPNRYLREFKVSRRCLLPVGFRLTPRHFTPGQLVDVLAVAKDKGVQGAMKKWGFAGQPASHGVSVSHRSLGSTGQKQDPSKVFKGKKMHGYMGGHTRCQYNLRVFKIDNSRSLIYLMGSVPGKVGELVEIQDGRFSFKKNKALLNFPTFVPEAGKAYASVAQVDPPIQDPSEVWLHDNILPKGDDEEEVASVATAADGDD